MTTADLGEWLRDLGLNSSIAITNNGEIPATPDSLVAITRSGGPGELRERTFDNVAFQVITRGAQRGPTEGEAFALAVDDLILGAVPPVTIGSTRVISISRTTGPPAHMETDEAQRRLFVAGYLLQVARGVH